MKLFNRIVGKSITPATSCQVEVFPAPGFVGFLVFGEF